MKDLKNQKLSFIHKLQLNKIDKMEPLIWTNICPKQGKLNLDSFSGTLKAIFLN